MSEQRYVRMISVQESTDGRGRFDLEAGEMVLRIEYEAPWFYVYVIGTGR